MSLNNFCSRCGSDKLSFNSPMFLCNSCGLEIYLNPKPTASLIFYCNNKVLIAQRSRDPFKGSWGLPGGFMENRESFEYCIQREILEELTIESSTPKYFCSIYNPEYIYKGENYQNICVIMYESISLEKYNQIKTADDVSAVKLISREDIGYTEFCFGIDKILERFFDEILIR